MTSRLRIVSLVTALALPTVVGEHVTGTEDWIRGNWYGRMSVELPSGAVLYGECVKTRIPIPSGTSLEGTWRVRCEPDEHPDASNPAYRITFLLGGYACYDWGDCANVEISCPQKQVISWVLTFFEPGGYQAAAACGEPVDYRPRPPIRANATARPLEATVNISWSPPPYPDVVLGYRVYRGSPGGFEAMIGETTTTWMEDTRVPRGDHAYSVAAFNSHGEGGRRSAGTVTVLSTFPPTVRNLVAEGGRAAGEVVLRWEPPQGASEPVIRYEVLDARHGWGTVIDAGTETAITLPFREAGVHTLHVRAVTAGGASAWSPGEEFSSAGPAFLAFGDSVAAGYGLGEANGYPNNRDAFPRLVADALGGITYNFAITGACSATPEDFLAHSNTYPRCKDSILGDQIPRALELGTFPAGTYPSGILINVGANDIGFSNCVADFMAGSYSPFVSDPCDGDLPRRLEALDWNLRLLVQRLRDEFGSGTPILLNQYFNPFPSRPSPAPCELLGSRAIRHVGLYREFSDDASWRGHLRRAELEAIDLSRRVLDDLNGVIRGVAGTEGLLTAAPDFSGHDLCRWDWDPVADQVWVFTPEVKLEGRTGGLFGGTSRDRGSGPGPGACERPFADPAPVGLPYTFADGSVSVFLTVNCFPHPTRDGHRGLSEAVLAALIHESPAG